MDKLVFCVSFEEIRCPHGVLNRWIVPEELLEELVVKKGVTGSPTVSSVAEFIELFCEGADETSGRGSSRKYKGLEEVIERFGVDKRVHHVNAEEWRPLVGDNWPQGTAVVRAYQRIVLVS